MPALQPSQLLSFREKVGYGLGDAGASLLFLAVGTFQFGFYTEIFGLSGPTAGTLLLVVWSVSILFDPLMGMVADRTWLRWGFYRFWIFWTAVPFGLLGFIAFLTPALGPSEKLAYAYATSFLFALVSSANRVPYSALGAVLSSDRAERTRLSTYRFVLALLAAGAIQAGAPSLLKMLGGGNDARGYPMTVGLLAILGAAFFFTTFFTTQERVHGRTTSLTPLKEDFADLRENVPWIMLMFVTLFVFATLALRAAATLVYFRSYLGRPDLFTAYNLCGLGAAIPGIVLAQPLVLRFGSRSVLMIALLGAAGLMASLVFLPTTAVGPVFALQALAGFSLGPALPLLWSMMADVADFSEWKNDRRATGLIFSGSFVGPKVGSALGGALGRWLLSGQGYAAHGGWSVRLGASVLPTISLLFGAACLIYYPIGEGLGREIANDLYGRRFPSGIRVDRDS